MRLLFPVSTIGGSSELGFEHPLPAWAIVLALVGCCMMGWWTYSRLHASDGWKMVLGSLRSLLLASILLLLLGPLITTSFMHHTSDRVLVLVDRSESMLVEDVENEEGSSTRDGQAEDILDMHQEIWNRIGVNRSINWFGFHGHVFSLDPGGLPTPELDAPGGSRTDLATALQHVLMRTDREPLSSIILLSDGRSTTPHPPDFLSTLRESGIPVFSIPLGSASTRGDASIRTIKAPGVAYDNDMVPVNVEVSLPGGIMNPVSGSILLVDDGTGTVLDRVPIQETTGDGEVVDHTLVGTPTMTGRSTWRVVLELDEPDLITRNNEQVMEIDLVDQPLRVLYIEGRPRWEYRYLKNLLLREETIESSTMLLSADRDFAQEGDRRISRLPSNMDELEYWDVLILGDLHSSSLTSQQSQAIIDLVTSGRLSVMWIGGERWTPSSWGGSGLVDLLPFTAPFQPLESNRLSHVRVLEPASRLGLFRIEHHGGDVADELYDPSVSWTGFQWMQRFDPRQIKPTTELFAVLQESEDGPSFPLVMSMQFGSGSVAYITSDEFWRWRHGHGERLYEQFWIQLLRVLGRSRDMVDSSGVRFTVSPVDARVGQPVRFDLEIFDTTLLEEMGDVLTLLMSGENGTPGGQVELRRISQEDNEYQGFWIPLDPGTVEAHLELPGLDQAIFETFTVADPGDEMNVPAADHGALETLSRVSGGRIIQPGEVNNLPDLVPDRSITTVETRNFPLWDSPWLFLVPMTLLALEWLGRRYLRLA